VGGDNLTKTPKHHGIKSEDTGVRLSASQVGLGMLFQRMYSARPTHAEQEIKQDIADYDRTVLLSELQAPSAWSIQ
jgi:hypothetical protein